jgi:gliding motility-associated-like protein
MKHKILFIGTFFIAILLGFTSGMHASSYSVNVYATDVNCFGDSSGSVTASVLNGVGPFTFTWSTGQVVTTSSSTHSLNNLKSGIYSVNVLDQGSGLTTFGMATVNQPQPISASLTATDVQCKGAQTAAIYLSVSGGSGQFNYLWSNGKTTRNISQLGAGTYHVVIRENNTPSCYIEDSIVIREPGQALSFSHSKKDVNCHGGQDGEIDLSVYGGTPPYTYSWNNGSYTTEDISQLPAATYSIEVRDAHNCYLNDQINISQPAALQYTLGGKDIKCFGEKTGEVSSIVSGGTAPYEYEWWNSSYKLSYTSPVIKNVGADTYKVRIRDANKCFVEDSFEISSPGALKSSIVSKDITAFGGQDGEINLEVTGGVKPYSYIWSNSASTQDLYNLSAGKYFVDIIDFNNCSIRDSAELLEPVSALSIHAQAGQVSCFGGNNGWIEIFPSGGQAPYSYLWSNGDTIPKIYQLKAGVYAIQITDQNGVSLLDSIRISEPSEINATAALVQNKCFDDRKASIDISVTGATPPYRYEWRNSDYVLSARTEDVTQLGADMYTVTVYDSNNCQASFSYQITKPRAIKITTKATDAPCFGGPSGRIDADVWGGTPPYQFAWTDGSTDEDLSAATPGVHVLQVTDQNGCILTASDSVGKMDSISFKYTAYDASCRDRKDGRAEVYDVQGGNGYYSYLWSNGDTLTETAGLDEGYITISITDFLGCNISKDIYIGEMDMECINIPTAFTPNGDGMNDTWVLRNVDKYPECVVKVFNRWGRIVFESGKGYPVEWDGSLNGKELPAGTYYYIFDLDIKEEPKNGMVTIVR